MSTNTTRKNSGPRHSSGTRAPMKRPVPRAFAAGLAVTLGVSGAAAGIAPASADPGYAESRAQYLSGTLLGSSLDTVAEVAGVEARSSFGDTEGVVNSNDLDLRALEGVVVLEAPGGVQIPLTTASLGVVGQYASSSPEASSFAATGLVASDGTIGVAPDETAPPGPAVISLSSLIGEEFSGDLDVFNLAVGAVTASASQEFPAEATGDYELANVVLELSSPVLADLDEAVLASAAEVDTTVSEIAGPDGSILADLTEALGVVGVVSDDSTASLEVNVQAAVSETLSENVILGEEGPVAIDLASGGILVDLDALLEANGQDLNALDESTDLLSPEVIGLVTDEVDELVDGLLTEVSDTVDTTLEAATLSVDLDVLPADGGDSLLSFTVDGTLADIESGDSVAVVAVGDAVEIEVAVSGLVSDLLAADVDVPALVAPVTDVYATLAEVLPEVATLEANVQEVTDGTFTQTALRLSLLNALDAEGQAVTLNLGSASVGPNALGENPAELPVVTSITPTSGPEAGGTEVVITGENFTGIQSVEFGTTPGNSFVVDSDTQIRVTTPGGTGTVPVTLFTSATAYPVAQEFTYVPAGEGPIEISGFTPETGPEAGDTLVRITGVNFTGAEEVLFGTTPALRFVVVSDSEIFAATPAGVGAVNISVDGVVSEGVFTYVVEGTPPGEEAPVVNAVTPNTGSEAGGTVVTIVGEDFNEVTEVWFGPNPATSFVIVSDNEIEAVTPAGTGVVDVSVVTPENGTGTSVGGFTYANTPPAETPEPPVVVPPVVVTPPAETPEGVFYENCAAVQAAGNAPLRSTDPGYRAALDRDGDGVACEVAGGNGNGGTTGGTANTAGTANNGAAATTAGGQSSLADTGVDGTQIAIGAAALLFIAGIAISGVSFVRSRS